MASLKFSSYSSSSLCLVVRGPAGVVSSRRSSFFLNLVGEVSSFGELSFGEVFSRGTVQSAKWQSGKCPRSGKCLQSGKCPWSGKCPRSGKCPQSGKCPVGEVTYRPKKKQDGEK